MLNVGRFSHMRQYVELAVFIFLPLIPVAIEKGNQTYHKRDISVLLDFVLIVLIINIPTECSS